MKLHLGCGGTYLDGYVNIDFSPNEKTIMNIRADVYCDIRDLNYEDDSIDEIRSHHLFEHFNRVDALRILIKWRRWLKSGGKLVIETPDYFWCSVLFPLVPHKFKMKIGRHIFGSQEDFWGCHLDFWYKSKFKRVLSKIGFEHFRFSHPAYRNLLPNIKVSCAKSGKKINEEIALRELLEIYILTGEDKERFFRNWLGDH